MTGAAPYVVTDPPVAVEVAVTDSTWPGYATGWRWDRVSVTWRTAPAMNHVGWFDASEVSRVS